MYLICEIDISLTDCVNLLNPNNLNNHLKRHRMVLGDPRKECHELQISISQSRVACKTRKTINSIYY